MSQVLRVAVMMGGGTSEHEISLLTGEAVVSALEEAGHQVDPVVLPDSEQLEAAIEDFNSDLVFIALHGGAGEDGRVQAALELAGIAYVGSRPGPCSVAMDKVSTKQLAREMGVPAVSEAVFGPDAADATILAAAADLGPATVFKPVDEGSAVGVHLCEDAAALALALEQINTRTGRWMLEPLGVLRLPEQVHGRLHRVRLPGRSPRGSGRSGGLRCAASVSCAAVAGPGAHRFPARSRAGALPPRGQHDPGDDGDEPSPDGCRRSRNGFSDPV